MLTEMQLKLLLIQVSAMNVPDMKFVLPVELKEMVGERADIVYADEMPTAGDMCIIDEMIQHIPQRADKVLKGKHEHPHWYRGRWYTYATHCTPRW